MCSFNKRILTEILCQMESAQNCLHLITHALQNTKHCSSSVLCDIFSIYVAPHLESARTQESAIKCLIQICLLDKFLAEKNINFILEMVAISTNANIQLLCSKVLFDFLLLYGIEIAERVYFISLYRLVFLVH